MKGIVPYLTFDGTCREAMTFYQQCLGGELSLMPFSAQMPDLPPGSEHRTMHAHLKSGPVVVMGSDTVPGTTLTQGDNVSINIDCESLDEIERLFAALGEGGRVTMPLENTFWNARFGMLRDRFGVNWMFNCELSPSPVA